MDLFLIWVVYGEVITWRCLGWLVRIYVVMGWAEDAIPADVGETSPFHWYPNSWLETREYRTNEKQTNHLSIPPPTFLPTMSFVSPSFGQPPIRSERMD